jgi:phosphoribosylformimino-5-aminoimidazole carboxamide ribotide isomerase
MNYNESEQFTLYPAIDLRQGRCVRLYQGDPNAETVFSDDPVATAQRWVAEGAEWLHVVNLDGAFEQASQNPAAVQAIARAVPVPIQFGGGLRTLDDLTAAFDWGIARAVIGTAAVRDPALLDAALQRFGPERLAVGIDARDGQVAIRGWQETSELTALDLAERVKAQGVTHLIYTDISRDGTLAGPNIAKTGELAHRTSLRLIASGGIGTLDHLRQLRWLAPYGVEGAIIGQALYTGAFRLADAKHLLETFSP